MATWTEPAFLADLTLRCHDVAGRIDDLCCGLPLDGDSGSASSQLSELLGSPPDLVIRVVGGRMRALYLSTTVNEARIEQAVVRPLTLAPLEGELSGVAFAAQLIQLQTYAEALDALLAGQAVLLRDGRPGGLAAAVAQWPGRPPTEPPGEIVPQGPHDGFIEDLQANIALLRHGLRNRHLRWERLSVGLRNATSGALLYVDGLVRPDLLHEVRHKLDGIAPSFVLDGQMLAEWLAPRSYLFPTVGTTERQDVARAALLEGRVVVLVEGSPVAIIVPQVFADLLHVPTDYYLRSVATTSERLLRLLGVIVALVASPLYVALITINLELVPTPLFVTIAKARLEVPVPAVAEVLVLEALVEVIRQAGLRMPGPFGQPVAIIGAVVLGQAAVLAGLASAPAVVVVSLAFIVSFTLPSHSALGAIRTLRFLLIAVAAAFGIFGLVWGIFLVLMYLCALESFGVPYLAPLSPVRQRGLQDVVWRRPLPGLQRSFVARRAGESGGGT